MPITEQHITTVKTARYFVIGQPDYSTKIIWIVLHGYAQQAREFIKIFEKYESAGKVIIAPEALNRFYVRGFTGKTGACWMTKEDREAEINDYVTFVNNVFHKTTAGINVPKICVNLLGFSQGAATAFRVFEANKFKIDNLILWAGSPPPDMDYKKCSILSVSTKISVYAGDKDKMMDSQNMLETMSTMDEKKIRYEFINYIGGHEITNELLEQYSIFK